MTVLTKNVQGINRDPMIAAVTRSHKVQHKCLPKKPDTDTAVNVNVNVNEVRVSLAYRKKKSNNNNGNKKNLAIWNQKSSHTEACATGEMLLINILGIYNGMHS